MKDRKIEVIKDFLESVRSKFSGINFRCEYNKISFTYIVEVTPLNEFEDNAEYADLEYDFITRFEEMFPKYIVMFVSDNSMTKIETPDFEICSFKNETSNIINFTGINDIWHSEDNPYMIAA